MIIEIEWIIGKNWKHKGIARQAPPKVATNKINKARQGGRQGKTKREEKPPKMEKNGSPGMGDILHK